MPKHKAIAFSLLLLGAPVLSIYAAGNVFSPPGCKVAERPLIPDGSAVSKTQLLEAKSKLDAYLSQGDKFLNCLKAYEDSFGEYIDGDKRVVIITSHNKMVDEMYLAGDEFNVALRKFKRRANR